MKSRLLVSCLIGTSLASAEPFALKEGDRVALVGNTVIERAQHFGHVETLLALAGGQQAKAVTFRNLGWSGDSVFADARSYFGKPKEGRDRLKRVMEQAKPTVLLVCYGTNAAMTGHKGWTDDAAGAKRSKSGDEESLKLFLENYAELLELMKTGAGPGLREIVLLSPPPLETLENPWPDQTKNNQKLARYRDAIRELAKKRGHRFVDLFELMGGVPKGTAQTPLTTNGIHYSNQGYRVLASKLVAGLGLKLPENLSDNEVNVVALRKTIFEKNRLFFHRWRPANETYLFLFRRHEQGNNAKEIPMFDPLIEAEEKKIEELRVKVLNELKG